MQSIRTMPDLRTFKPFDSCVTLASASPWHLAVEDLLESMDRYQIAEALVIEQHARVIPPCEHGNRRLLEALRGKQRLHPVWVIAPPLAPGPAASRRLVEDMLAAGVRAARFPLNRTPPLPWMWQDLCRELEAHRVPCFLDFGGATTTGCPNDATMNDLHGLALQHPDLPLVFSHVMGGLGIHPGILHLLRRTPNTYLDTAGILEYWRETARDLGAERVLFATGTPFTDAGVLISNIQYTQGFDETAKRNMYGDNLRRLLGNVK